MDDSPGRLLLLRHGETEWSCEHRHTGRTDLELTADGEEQARAAGGLLRRLLDGREPALVLTSPLRRARHTAELVGLDAEDDDRLLEWDYGDAEGLTREEVQEQRGADWSPFTHGVGPGETPGETPQQVSDRGEAVLRRVRPVLNDGDVVLVGHGHALRVLAATWLDGSPELAARMPLGTAAVCVLGAEHGTAAVLRWNLTADLLDGPTPTS